MWISSPSKWNLYSDFSHRSSIYFIRMILFSIRYIVGFFKIMMNSLAKDKFQKLNCICFSPEIASCSQFPNPGSSASSVGFSLNDIGIEIVFVQFSCRTELTIFLTDPIPEALSLVLSTTLSFDLAISSLEVFHRQIDVYFETFATNLNFYHLWREFLLLPFL